MLGSVLRLISVGSCPPPSSDAPGIVSRLPVPGRAGIPGFAHDPAKNKKPKTFRANARKINKRTKKHKKHPPKTTKTPKKDEKKHPVFFFALTREIKPLASKKNSHPPPRGMKPKIPLWSLVFGVEVLSFL